MFNPFVRLYDTIDEDAGLGGKPASERDAFGTGVGGGRAPERIGSISRSIEERALGHTASASYPEGHVAGLPGVGMDPGIPARHGTASRRVVRASHVAGSAAGTVARWAHNSRNVRNIQPQDARREAEHFITEHPVSLAGAALAGFLLGRLLRR
ncbi:MAG TPA: hypothetical protein VN428_18165 [Bryobacteraceae bacterium]|nr:hypothetical protein [Bryobacteraceae bacterium]